MSELKAYIAPTPDGTGLADYYLKSEADKVIAEKDEVIEEMEERIDELQKATDSAWSKVNEMYDELRHHKYKRCLAMARWCRMHDEFTQLESERLGLPQRTLFLEYRRKAMWWNKWQKRWLELAEKFKEAK